MQYRNHRIIRPFPAVDDDRLAELWGFFLGDGYLQKSALSVYVKGYEVDFIVPLLRLVGLPKENKGDVGRRIGWVTKIVRYDVNNKRMAEEYRRHFYPKGVPLWMLEKSLFYRKRVLQGLFEAEGSVQRVGSHVRVSFTNTNKSIVDFVTKTLGDLGVEFGYRGRGDGVHKQRYDIWTRKSGVRVFRDKVGFLTPEKNARLVC